MREYSPKRRTALVLTGSGTAAAYHAGVLKALDESGVKVDLLVGSGAGVIAAAFGAVAAGPKLYGPGGFWDGVSWTSFYRLRFGLRTAAFLLGSSFGIFLLPLIAALIAGLLFPLALVADVIAPGSPGRLLGALWAAPSVLREPYLALLAAPVFALSTLAVVFALRLLLRHRRRAAEFFEAVLDPTRALDRLGKRLWEITRGPAISAAPPAAAELGKRYVTLAAENLGQPGFRELILRTADLETGRALSFLLLQDGPRSAFTAARGRGPRLRLEGILGAVDLRVPGYEPLLFDAVATGLLPLLAAPVRRVSFPRGGTFAGETHRLADATLTAGCGVSEALAAGAEQVIVATAMPEVVSPPPRRRGVRALADAVLASLERSGIEGDVGQAERINRMVETLGHKTEDGGRGWQDPATGRLYRDVALYVVRPERRGLGPLELDGARDPGTEVEETLADLQERGYRDAYRLFIEPIVGAVPEPGRAAVPRIDQTLPVGL